MANPEHIEPLDSLDRLTVRLYRGGLAAASIGLLLTSIALVAGPTEAWVHWAEVLTVAGIGSAIACMHLYDKYIRWIIGAAGWLGAILMMAGALDAGTPGNLLHHAGLGFFYVSLSAFALKEQFCFKIPLLRAVPAFLALSLIPLVAGMEIAAAPLLAIAGLVTARLTMAKVRMPLHFDIGSKDAYKI